MAERQRAKRHRSFWADDRRRWDGLISGPPRPRADSWSSVVLYKASARLPVARRLRRAAVMLARLDCRSSLERHCDTGLPDAERGTTGTVINRQQGLSYGRRPRLASDVPQNGLASQGKKLLKKRLTMPRLLG